MANKLVERTANPAAHHGVKPIELNSLSIQSSENRT